MKKYILLSLLLTMMLCSCMTDYILTCTIDFQNNSSHEIHFICWAPQDNNKDQEVIKHSIPIGGSLQLFGSKESAKRDKNFFSALAVQFDNRLHKIRFGETVEVTFIESKYQYDDTYKRIGKSKYRYTFTDDDYQFALENGTVLE